jgi:hypothetical protein
MVDSTPFSRWSENTFDDVSDFTFQFLAEEGISKTSLQASMVLAPLTVSVFDANRIITAQLTAYAKQFNYIYDKTYLMGLLRKIEYVTGTDLDNIWGRIYGVKRISGEPDEKYRKRLQIYLLQVGGSATKPSVERIISIIVGRPNACRVDTYWPGYCRIYITDSLARENARDRLDLINKILPDTLAAGVTYRFYNPYFDLDADIVLHGPEKLEVPVDLLLSSKATSSIEAGIMLVLRSSTLLDSDLVIAADTRSDVRSYMALRDLVSTDLSASEVLKGLNYSELSATQASSAPTPVPLASYERLVWQNDLEIEADVAVQDNRLRPIEVRIRLEAA